MSKRIFYALSIVFTINVLLAVISSSVKTLYGHIISKFLFIQTIATLAGSSDRISDKFAAFSMIINMVGAIVFSIYLIHDDPIKNRWLAAYSKNGSVIKTTFFIYVVAIPVLAFLIISLHCIPNTFIVSEPVTFGARTLSAFASNTVAIIFLSPLIFVGLSLFYVIFIVALIGPFTTRRYYE